MLEHLQISNNPVVHDRVLQLKDIQAKLSDHLLNAQASYKKAADRYRLDSSTNEPKFWVGDRVWLLRRNVKTTKACDKLDNQRFGPFVISRQINDVAFPLDLPQHMHLHLVFRVSLLEPYNSTLIQDQVVPPLP